MYGKKNYIVVDMSIMVSLLRICYIRNGYDVGIALNVIYACNALSTIKKMIDYHLHVILEL